MRINMMGSGGGGASDTKVFEADTLVEAATARAHDYQTLRGQFEALRATFQGVTQLGSSDFQGQGADAIRSFYEAQSHVVDAWLRLIDKRIAFFKGIPGMIDNKNLGGDTYVNVPFLEDDLVFGRLRSSQLIEQQQDGIRKILNRISDLVTIDVFSTKPVENKLDEADDRRQKMVHDVRSLDQELTSEYRQLDMDFQYVAALYSELINATRVRSLGIGTHNPDFWT
ncbi:LXG domain-containing protein [Sporolactobacillus sp. THM19-2]|uniref:LXG domain-containing protein n=1 Tax=Sporolactobacillus sp. THM19-2 TaxID=2511171 RepID=UPI00101FFEA8|nr:LXG domain-containing protein [Sporolactobacillus sp. THM19-2]RYL93280.1 hypothetical protein EWH91_05400 [Sporolactobacillus sp. THM19-2]